MEDINTDYEVYGRDSFLSRAFESDSDGHILISNYQFDFNLAASLR